MKHINLKPFNYSNIRKRNPRWIFSGKVGNVVGSRLRGKKILRSLPQRGSYTPSTKQEEQHEKFKKVISFLSPIVEILSQYFGSPQGDKSRSNLATSYHLKNAVVRSLDI